MEFCAALGVAEIWRYDGVGVQMYELKDGAYLAATESRFFPGFTCGMLLAFLERSKIRGQTESLKAFREHLRAHRGR